ncbi:peptide ABC transporter substrate-binding protein [Fictibacillus sp. KU28468]|uniref:peptide ABC transporter substrate-binding protein n=1 Tax=Fictibacillus sp. KU28468 TaxID=2991053 RepID=UPI00223C9686|nr:peptide ABC transporter substrate-binding protein [Fictibacillus sp. KU28468]UZJ79432.1 peptide ABC transporter substrate-binding protein [Fictibacillus sp. KU28468]
MEYLTKRQKEVLWKKEFVVRLRDVEGLTFEQIDKKLNEELKKQNLKEISNHYSKVTYNNLKRGNKV